MILLKKLNNAIGYATFFVLPIPIFFDFSSGGFHLNDVSINGRNDHLGFPVPLGALLFLIHLGLGFIARAKQRIKFKNPLDISVSILLGLYVLFCILSRYSLIGVLQLVCFPFLFLYIFHDENKRRYLITYMAGGAIFSLLHFISLLSLIDFKQKMPWDRMLWERLFNLEIYQGLVSYVNVLGLMALISLWCFILDKRRIVIIFAGFLYLLTMYMAALSSQRAFVLDLIIITALSFFLIFSYNRISKRRKIWLFSFVIIAWAASLVMVGNNLGSPVVRLFNSVKNIVVGSYDSDSTRYISQKNTINAVKERLENVDTSDGLSRYRFEGIVYGSGVVHTGAHNFILDQIVGVGVLGTLCYFFSVLLIFIRLIRQAILFGHEYAYVFMIALVLMCGAACLVNSPLTQPLYFINLIACTLMLVNTRLPVAECSFKKGLL